ncbi:MAG: flagellar basal body P-ring formation chaperone FlgA [Gallionella sp.]|nr:flagellar basal body P-ring formation chaperone FlgA [Gallionella sp.]
MNKLLLIAFLLLQSAAAEAAPARDTSAPPPLRNDPSVATQDHAQIRNIVAGFVQQQTATLPGKVTFQIDEIDRRIILPPCAELEAFLPAGSQLIGKTSIGVRCPPSPRKEETNDRSARTNGWRIFVPVQIRLNLNLLTSAHQLPPGHTLQEQDLASQSTETSQSGGFTDPKQVLGKVLRYGIAAGQVLREDMLRQPYSVTQGQIVQLAVQGNGFSIRSEGVALNNASEGQTVQIRVGPGRVISGVARVGGVVEIVP